MTQEYPLPTQNFLPFRSLKFEGKIVSFFPSTIVAKSMLALQRFSLPSSWPRLLSLTSIRMMSRSHTLVSVAVETIFRFFTSCLHLCRHNDLSTSPSSAEISSNTLRRTCFTVLFGTYCSLNTSLQRRRSCLSPRWMRSIPERTYFAEAIYHAAGRWGMSLTLS